MATLKQLIADGLQVGALVVAAKQIVWQIVKINQHGFPVLECVHKHFNTLYDAFTHVGDRQSSDCFYNNNHWQLTTAHDSNIDPETLPIPEPFWTGWFVVVSGDFKNNEPKEFSHISRFGNRYMVFTPNTCGFYLEDCRPCLPPNP